MNEIECGAIVTPQDKSKTVMEVKMSERSEKQSGQLLESSYLY